MRSSAGAVLLLGFFVKGFPSLLNSCIHRSGSRFAGCLHKLSFPSTRGLRLLITLSKHATLEHTVATAEGRVIVSWHAGSKTNIMSVAARGQSFQVRHENRDNFGLSGSRATAIGMNCDLIVIGRFPGRARRSDFSEQLDVMFWQFLQLMARSLESDCLSCKNQEDQKQRRVGFEKHLKLY